MSGDELQRIQDELTAIRHVVKRDKPYAAADIAPLIAIGLGALVAIPLLKLKLLGTPRICLLTALIPGIFLYARRYRQAQQDKGNRPVLWKEYKWGVIVAIVLLPAAVGWIWWSQKFGTTREIAGAAIIFSMGVGSCILGTIDSNRRGYLLSGLAAIVFAFILPSLEPQQVPIAGSTLLAGMSLTGAALIWRFTRNETTTTDSCEPPA